MVDVPVFLVDLLGATGRAKSRAEVDRVLRRQVPRITRTQIETALRNAKHPQIRRALWVLLELKHDPRSWEMAERAASMRAFFENDTRAAYSPSLFWDETVRAQPVPAKPTAGEGQRRC